MAMAQQDLGDLTSMRSPENADTSTSRNDLARAPGADRATQDTLHAFFDFLGPERTAALEGICCDMWQPYIDVITARAQAVLVFDKFHIVSHLMKAVDQVRRDEIREKGPAQKVLMHKTRFIWLKNPWNLTERQHCRLGEIAASISRSIGS